jgi:hypothetical protein
MIFLHLEFRGCIVFQEKIERQIGSLASKMDTNQARMEERLREAVNSVRSELDEKIEKPT